MLNLTKICNENKINTNNSNNNNKYNMAAIQVLQFECSVKLLRKKKKKKKKNI